MAEKANLVSVVNNVLSA